MYEIHPGEIKEQIYLFLGLCGQSTTRVVF